MASKKSTSFFSGLSSAGPGLKALTSLRTPDGGTPTVSSEVTDYPPPERDPQKASTLLPSEGPKRTLTPDEQSKPVIIPITPPRTVTRSIISKGGVYIHAGLDVTSPNHSLYAMADGEVLPQSGAPPYDPSGWPAAKAAIAKELPPGSDPWGLAAAKIAERYIKNSSGNVLAVRSSFDPPLLGKYSILIWDLLHLAEPTKFKGGDKVTKGQFLGNYGETGFISGAHMHLDIINGVSGRIIDPLVFFQLMGYTI